jgi:hypothetical protein
MTLRRSLLVIGSAALTVLLIALLIRLGKIDLRVTFHQLRSVSWISFTKLIFLTGLLSYLSTKKWRTIDAAWRRPSDTTPSTLTSFTLTSAGLALGTFLPAQLAMSTARTLGTHVHGRALKRGAAGTLYEQGFDLLTVGFLAIASGITRLYRGGAMMWTLSAAMATTLAILAVGPSVRLLRRGADSRTERIAAPRTRVEAALRRLFEMRHSSVIDAGLARRLVILSALRFGVVVLMSVQTAELINVHIPVWQMAAAIPFVVMASVIALTPGGLGVNELTSVTALRIFGTPLTVGAQWAVANRVLIAVSYFLVAGCAALLLAAQRIIDPGAADRLQDR